MLQAFSIKVYASLDLDATLCLENPFVSMQFNVLLDFLKEFFSVSPPMGDLIFAIRVN